MLTVSSSAVLSSYINFAGYSKHSHFSVHGMHSHFILVICACQQIVLKFIGSLSLKIKEHGEYHAHITWSLVLEQETERENRSNFNYG